ncbi:hypothetical protein [Chryseosolibacter indicus]|uniref:Uncharacterized protein n=1 Tax=Chryseosolibacter indicus TaxID=2782351 RepID=A0ABS5VRE2_9BACT|nr:hypothetical protein [Chryseosolibacter indicus]MBT1704019.1 hypothetical protein [Chryseosolibacter indicus]
MRSNIVIAGGLLLFLAIVITTLRPPMSMRTEKHSITEQGVVVEMYETAFKDLVVKLQGQASTFYINVNKRDKIDLAALKDKLLNKKVMIQYDEPLFKNKSEHFISKLEYDGEVIYSDK